MERLLALKGLNKNKKRYAMIFVVVLLAAFLLQFCSMLRSSLNRTIEEDRFNTYGAFTHYIEEDVSDDITSKIRVNKDIKRVGQLIEYGSVNGASIGFADNTAIDLGRIRLESGRMPELAHEIAVEPAILLANGYTTELGQTIILHVVSVVDPEKSAEMEFVLCGVLKEYTVLWGFGLSGLLSEAGVERLTNEIGKARERTFLFESDQYPGISSTQTNLNAYPRESLQNITTLLGYAVWMIAAVSSSILLVCIVFSVLKRTETWRFFRDLGAEKGQIQRIVLWEGLYLSVAGLPIGSILGIVAALVISIILPSPAGDRWYIALSASDILDMFVLSTISASVGILIPSFLVRRTPLLAGNRKIRSRKYSKRKGNIGFLSVLVLMLERIRAQRSMTAILICVLLSCGIISALAIHLVSYNTSEIREVAQNAQNGELILDRTYDRVDGMYDSFSIIQENYMYYQDFLPLDKGTIREIEDLYGVEEVKKYMIKSSDYNRFEPYGNATGGTHAWDNPRYEDWRYSCNRAFDSYGGVSALLYMDLSMYDDNPYFEAYITGEKARAAYSLVCYGGWSHSIDKYFGKAMSYYQEAGEILNNYFLHTTEGKTPTKAELEEYYSQFHIVQWNEIEADIKNCNATIWGVEGQEAAGLIHASEGDLNLQAFENGTECIIVLPDIYFTSKELDPEPNYPPVKMHTVVMEEHYKYQNLEIGFDYELKNTLFSDEVLLQGYGIYHEDTIQVGDTIPVKYLDETVEVRVGAILRELPQDMVGYPYSTLRPYTIITGENFFDRIPEFSCPDAYECITIELNGKQPSSVIEMQIKQIIKNLDTQWLILSNLDADQQALEQNAWVNISTLVLFTVLYFAVVLIVLSIIFSISMESQRRRIAVLRALGMEVKKIQLSYLIESLLYSVIGFVGAVPVMLTVWGIVQYKTFGSGGPWLSYIVSNGCLNFMWWAYGLVFLAVTIGVLCTLYLPLQKFFKDNIIDQLQS